MEYINSLSLDVVEIDLKYKNLNILPNLSRFTCLQKLECSYNQITQINNLPPFLQILDCSYNQITQLDNLPLSLIEL